MVKPQDQIFNTALKEGTKIAGELLKNYFLGQYQTARDATYDTLTSKIEKPNEADHFTAASVRQPGVFQTDLFGRKDAEADYSQGRWKRYGQYKDPSQKGGYGYDQTVRPTQVDVQPHLNRETGQYEAIYDRKPSERASYIPGFAYNNPETTAAAVGILNPLAQIGLATAVGAGIYNYSKPRSDYALAVQDSAQQGGYNPNVEAAQASAMYRAALEEQKFQHKMALMDHRQQAATPGVQDYGQAVLNRRSPSGIPQMGDPYGMVNNIMSAPIPTYGV